MKVKHHFSLTHPDYSICRTCHHDILRVPLVCLRECNTQNLLHSICPAHARVHTCKINSINAPHMQPCSSTSCNVTLPEHKWSQVLLIWLSRTSKHSHFQTWINSDLVLNEACNSRHKYTKCTIITNYLLLYKAF